MNPNIDPKTIDYAKLRAERKAIDQEILELKKELRSPWERPMGAEQNQLRRLKQEATELCILRAYLRGKWHLNDEALCREIAARLLPSFLKPVLPAELPTGAPAR